jgi:hypothetical protein
MWRITIASLVLAVSAFAQASAAPAQAPTICGNQPLCFEASDFAATITDFRTSLTGGYHLMDVTIRFTNKTNGLLIMGYANGSGTATDDRGNRYVLWGGNALRGMGYVNGQQFDPKFQVRAGGYGDARFELLLQGNPQVLGFTFELDLTVNEINAFQGNQYTLGGEFPLIWKGLQNGAAGAAPGQVAVAGGGGAAGAAGSLTSIPCQNSSVQNVANGANNAASTVSATVASIGGLFGKKQQPQAAASSSPTVPCTPQSGAAASPTTTTTTTSTGAVVTKPAATTAPAAAAQKAVATTPTKAVTPAAATTPKPTTQPATTPPASTPPKPSSP